MLLTDDTACGEWRGPPPLSPSLVLVASIAINTRRTVALEAIIAIASPLPYQFDDQRTFSRSAEMGDG